MTAALLAKTFSIFDIKKAQKEFLAKTHVGNFVILPHSPGSKG